MRTYHRLHVYGSLGTFNPPGYGWLYVPGACLFPGQPGLAGALGSAMLFTGTVTGLALLLATRFGLATSIGTVAMFSYSSIGMFYATSPWPRAHVFFYCWTVYLLKRWAFLVLREAEDPRRTTVSRSHPPQRDA